MRGQPAMIKIAAIKALVVRRWSLVAFIFLISLFPLKARLAEGGTIHLSLFTNPVHAGEYDPYPDLTVQEAIDQINKCAIEKNVFDDKIFNLNQIAGTTDSLYNLLTGTSDLHPDTNSVTQNTGALAASGNLVALMYSTPPVSGVEYFAQKFRDINPVQPVYAQAGTTGFAALQPVQALWSVFRNISYIGFVIVFVIMGFMIMFRAHISPQAVATVQDSIPRIIIALILVTFSYAIAGLLIDVMFLVLNILIRTLEAAGLLTDGDYVFRENVFGIIFGSWKGVFTSVFDSVKGLIDGVLDLGFFGEKIISFFGGTIAGLVVGIALLFIMFRIFLMLLMAYAMIIILTMAAPFFFLIQSLPGRNGAGEWFKQMASQIAVFPTVALMFIFAGILGGIESLGAVPGSGSAIDQGQVGVFPLLSGGINSEVIGGLIGIGILLLTPQAAELVKNAIGVKGPQLGAGAMAGAAAGGAVVGAAAGKAGQYAGGYANRYNPLARGAKMRAAEEQEKIAADTETGIYSKRYGNVLGPPKNKGPN